MKRSFQRVGIPLAFYYAVTLALPLANGAGGPEFREHALAVFSVPLCLIVLFSLARGAARQVRRSSICELPPVRSVNDLVAAGKVFGR